jgi:two-component system, sensor histidine kinase and response regulator
MIFRLALCVLSFVCAVGAFAQTEQARIDSFKRVFDNATESQQVIQILKNAAYYSSKYALIDSNKYVFLQHCLQTVHRKKDAHLIHPHIEQLIGAQFFWRKNGKIVALDYLLKSLMRIEASHDSTAIELSYNFLSIIFYEIGDLENAEKYATMREKYVVGMVSGADNLTKKQSVISTYNTIGLIFQKRQQWDKAIANFRKAIFYAQKFKEEFWEGLAIGNIGTIYYKQGKFEEALPLLRKDIEISIKHHTYSNAVVSLCDIVRIHLTQQNYTEARKIWEEATLYIEKVPAIKEELGIFATYYEVSALYYENLKDYERALYYRKKYEEADKENTNFKREEDLKSIKFKYDYELKQRDIATLTKQNEEQRFYLYIIGFSLLVLILITLLFAQRYRQKNKISIVLHKHNQALTENLAQISTQSTIIEQQNQELKAINLSKDKIFSIISHDLRSPLGSLKNIIQLLKDDDLSKKELQEVLPIIESNLDYTFNLSEELLYWARSQMKGLQILPACLNPKQIIQQTILHLQDMAQEKNVRLVMGTVIDAPIVWADENMTKTVLRNFIVNAIKFSPQGTQVTVVAYEIDDARVRFVVKDAGTGIKPENLPKIFGHEPFTTKGTADEKGTGFGLLLCKDLVSQNGGEIGVHSVWGEGSNFYFTLPKTTSMQN